MKWSEQAEVLKCAVESCEAKQAAVCVAKGACQVSGCPVEKVWSGGALQAQAHREARPKKSEDPVLVELEKYLLIEKYIRRKDGKYQVLSEAGKVLGTHDTKAEAVAQLGAIEANKPKQKSISDEDGEIAFDDAAAVEVKQEQEWRPKFKSQAYAKCSVCPNRTNAEKVEKGSGDFTDCLDRIAPKAKPDDPEAFCAWYEHEQTGRWPGEKEKRGAPGIDEVHGLTPGTNPLTKVAEPGSEVLTLIFDKEKYPVTDAKAWAKDHGYASGTLDETEDSVRLKQTDPETYTRMRTITLTAGIKAIIGVPKTTVKALQAAFSEFCALRKIVFKSNEILVEGIESTPAGTIYRIAYGPAHAYFAAAGGHAAPLPEYKTISAEKIVWFMKAEGKAKQYTLGVVYPKGEVDFHGDTMDEDELEKAAWSFMSKDGVGGRVGLMHRPGTAGAGRVVESYVYRGPDWTMKRAGGKDKGEETVRAGDWLMGVVWNEEAWKAVQAGEITGYSLQGVARKSDVE